MQSLPGPWKNYPDHLSSRIPYRGEEAKGSLPRRRPVVNNDQLVWGVCQVGSGSKNNLLQGQSNATPCSSVRAEGGPVPGTTHDV
jgi:hypothetical protein